MTAFEPAVVWPAIAVLAVGTYALRASFLLGAGLLSDLPPAVREALDLVPVAVLAGLVASALVVADGGLAVGNARVLAGAVAAAVAWRTGSLLLTVAVGMGTLWALQWLPGLG